MKAFRPMRGSEGERRELIDRLKKVRDPRERERILWALEGMKKDSIGVAQYDKPAKEPEAPPQKGNRMPVELPKGIGFLTRYAAPLILIIFGLAFILQAVLRGAQRKDFASEIGQFVTGAIFVIFGFVALQKAKRIGQAPESSGEEKKTPFQGS
jgi:hypothetical protein